MCGSTVKWRSGTGMEDGAGLAFTVFNDTFLIVFFFAVVVCFIYLFYCTFNSWPMYQLVLCIQVYTELYVYIFLFYCPTRKLVMRCLRPLIKYITNRTFLALLKVALGYFEE